LKTPLPIKERDFYCGYVSISDILPMLTPADIERRVETADDVVRKRGKGTTATVKK
jgi:hypothetical protein